VIDLAPRVLPKTNLQDFLYAAAGKNAWIIWLLFSFRGQFFAYTHQSFAQVLSRVFGELRGNLEHSTEGESTGSAENFALKVIDLLRTAGVAS
jgi:hypothetical protein